MLSPVGGPTESDKDDSDTLPNKPETRVVTKARLEILKRGSTDKFNELESLTDLEDQNMSSANLSLELY